MSTSNYPYNGESSKENARLGLAASVYPPVTLNTVPQTTRDKPISSEAPTNNATSLERQTEVHESTISASPKGNGEEKTTVSSKPALTRPVIAPWVSGLSHQQDSTTVNEFLTAFPQDYSEWEALFRTLHSSLEGENQVRLCQVITLLNNLRTENAAWERKDKIVEGQYNQMVKYNEVAEKRHTEDEKIHMQDNARADIVNLAASQVFEDTPTIPMLSIQIISERDELLAERHALRAEIQGLRRDKQRPERNYEHLRQENQRLGQEMRRMQLRHEEAQGELGRKNQSIIAKQENAQRASKVVFAFLRAQNRSLRATGRYKDEATISLRGQVAGLRNDKNSAAFRHMEELAAKNALQEIFEKTVKKYETVLQAKKNEIMALKEQNSNPNALQKKLETADIMIASLTASNAEALAASQTNFKKSKEHKELEKKAKNQRSELKMLNDRASRLEKEAASNAKQRIEEKKSSDKKIHDLKNQAKALKANKESKLSSQTV